MRSLNSTLFIAKVFVLTALVLGCESKTAKVDATPAKAPGKADVTPSGGGEVAGWSDGQLAVAVTFCKEKADPGITAPKRDDYCRCLAREIGVKGTPADFEKDKLGAFERATVAAGDACRTGEQTADIEVDEAINNNRWNAEQIAAAESRCELDVAKFGLKLDAARVKKACVCLLKKPRESEKYDEFAKTLPVYVQNQAKTDGLLGECIRKTGFPLDEIDGRKWHKPLLAASYAEGTLERPNVAFDDTGKIGVIWVVNEESGDPALWARVFDQAAGGWKSPSKIGTSKSYLGLPQIVFLAAGGVRALWVETQGDVPSVYKAELGDGKWNPPSVVGSRAFSDAKAETFVFEGDVGGRVTVGYVARSEKLEVLQASPTGEWGSPRNFAGIAPPRIATNEAGDILLAWSSSSGLQTAIIEKARSNEDTVATPGPSVGTYFDLAVDRSSYLFVAFQESGEVRSRRFTDLTSWSEAQTAATGSILLAPKIASSSGGAAVAVWIDASNGSAKTVSGGAFHPFKGWTPGVPVSSPAAEIDGLALVRSPSGRALAVWAENPGGGKQGKVWIAPFE